MNLKMISSTDELEMILSSKIGQELNFDELPSAFQLRNMRKAGQRIIEGIKNNEYFLIVGDYDVDGIVSATIVVDFLKTLTPNVDYVIPDRIDDGYGVKPHLIKNRKVKPSVVITVDNGIVAFDAIQYCKENNIDLIITDHHTPPAEDDEDVKKLDDAYAIINPHMPNCSFPFPQICGATVAWYLCKAIAHLMKITDTTTKYVEFVALATVADVVPLISVNRTIVQKGLEVMNSKPSAFFKLTAELKNRKFITSTDLAFLFAPMINAIGRLENANSFVSICFSKAHLDVYHLVEKLNKINEERKVIQANSFEHLEEKFSELNKEKNSLVVIDPDLHEGLVGILAGSLVQKYSKPTLVLTEVENGFKGSGRATGNVNLLDVLEEINEDYFYKSGNRKDMGGHKEACGVTIKKEYIEDFKRDFEAIVDSKYTEKDFKAEDEIVGELNKKTISMHLIQVVNSFQPFGHKNPEPVFYLRDVYVSKKRLLQKKHLKLTLEVYPGVKIDGLVWNIDKIKDLKQINEKEKYNLSCTLGINSFQGKKSIQAYIKNIE